VFRKMRRINQLLSDQETQDVLKRCTHGVLACLGDEDYPYAVPLSFVYFNNKVYFHSAKQGHKIDAVSKNPKVSFSVIDEDTVVSKEYTTYFRSVIIFGKARIVHGEERTEAFMALIEKYSGDQPEESKQKEANSCMQSLILAVDPEYITGKQSIEFVRNQKRQS